MNHPQTTHQVTRSRFFAVATVGAFLIAISEMVFMASPFAAYFYSAFSPVLKWTENHSYLMWLTDFFVPHLSTPASAWFGSLLKLPRYLTFVGIASFATHAGYLYWMKFVRKRVGYRFALSLRSASPIPQLRSCRARASILLAKIHQPSALFRDAHRFLRSGADRRGTRPAPAWRALPPL